uniref:phage tail assembly chaperone G n=1 Tax=Staphylococcus sp. GDK8D68P TaxID=2804092 RepID=UPI001AEC3E2C
MKNNSIELITQFDESGNPVRTETFLTRPTIKLVLVYECVSFLSTLSETPDTNDIQQMMDLTVRIYDEQFTKNQLIDGLPSHLAVPTLYQQIIFIASGNQITDEIEQ